MFVPCYIIWKVYLQFAAHRGNSEWSKWVKAAQLAIGIEEMPVLRAGSPIQECLLAYLPKEGHSQRYPFRNAEEAEDFCSRHRQTIAQRLRSEFSHHSADEQLALGFVEDKHERLLLLFRQIDHESGVFCAVRHHRIGNIVNLISYRWAVFNRDASWSEGRATSDARMASSHEGKTGFQHTWRGKAAWGLLGNWHKVDAICRLHEWNGSPPGTAVADSELAYFEEIIQIETVKQVLTHDPSSSSASSRPNLGDQTAPPQRPQTDFL
jgi:hypothetical protein